MALSGSVNTSDYNGRYYRVSWTATQDTGANKSTVSWKLEALGGSATWYAERTLQVVIAGQTVVNKTDRVERYAGTIATGTVTIAHNSSGSASFQVAISAAVYGSSVNCTGSQTFALDTIYRASGFSAGNGTLGTAQTITVSRPSSSLTHTLTYTCGGASGTIASKSSSTSISWTPPLSLAAQNPVGTSVSIKLTLQTYSGNTLTGTSSKTISCAIPASVKPTCSLRVIDPTGVKDRYGVLLQGLSKFEVTVTAGQAQGAEIRTYRSTANGATYSVAAFTTGELLESGDQTVTATVTDTRGRSASASATFPVEPYHRPTIAGLTVHRCDADGTENDQGEHVKISFSAEVAPIGNKNTAAYRLRYKKTADKTFTEETLTALAGQYTVAKYERIIAADSGSSYDIEVDATDNHATTLRSTSASTAATILNFHPSGTGVGVGKVAEETGTLDVAYKGHFRDTVRLDGNRYIHAANGGVSTDGYLRMANITLIGLHGDCPITFVFTRRLAPMPMTVHLTLSRNSNDADSSLLSICYEGANYDAYITQAGAASWDLYVHKGTSNELTLQEWYTSKMMDSRIKVTFPGDMVSQVPTPYWKATPAEMRSLLDYIYPVGSIYLSYSHVSPADLFGGSWTRIQNAFLWAVDADGTIGQTGGEKTHTLTVAELPAHSHGATYTNAGESRTHSWLTSGGSAMGYNAVDAGGGQAHNNMPPYIQVSAWRRTS